jgi:starvation-inducible outer membrane lipoprotein
MRTKGLFVMSVLLAACTTTPVFPPDLTRDIKTDSGVLKAWKEQTSYPSGANFSSHKVQLGGQITQVIWKPEGVVILAEEQPIDKYLGYGPTSVRRGGSFEFAIVFNGLPNADALQVGNQLAVVGTTDRARPETIGWMPRVIPHLRAQCLDIWKTQGFETDTIIYQGSMGYYPLEKRTFCQEEGKGDSLSTGGGQGNQATSSTGS